MGGGAGAALAEVMLGWIGSQPMGTAYAKARKTGGGWAGGSEVGSPRAGQRVLGGSARRDLEEHHLPERLAALTLMSGLHIPYTPARTSHLAQTPSSGRS